MLLLGSVLVFIVSFIFSNFIYDSYSVARVSVTILFSLLLTIKVISKPLVFLNMYKNIFFLLLLYALFESIFSSYISTPFEHLQQEYIAISYILFITTFYALKGDKYTLRSYLLFISLVSILYFLFILFTFLYDAFSIKDSVIYYFKNIRFLNHLQTLIIPSLGLALFLSKKESYKAFFTLLLILNFLLLIETGGRGSFYSLLIVYFLFFLTNLQTPRVKNNILLVGSIFVISLFLYISIHFLFIDKDIVNHILDASSSGRINIYKTLTPLVFQGDFFFSAIGFSSQDIATYGYLHPHNLFLYVFLGIGSFGLVLFISGLLYYASLIVSEYLKSQNSIKKYLFIILMALFIHSLVSGVYITPLISVVFLYFMILFRKYYLLDKYVVQSSNLKYFNTFFVILLLFSSLFLGAKNYMLKKEYDYPTTYKEFKLYNTGIMQYSTRIFK